MNGQIRTLGTMELPERQQHLFQHLLSNEKLIDIQTFNADTLEIYAENLLQQLQKGDGPWKDKLPPAVYQTIKSKRLFGYGSI